MTTIYISAKTDIGKMRTQNEDAFILCPDLAHPDWGKSHASTDLGDWGAFVAVADGMGGANAGDVASTMAIESVKTIFSSEDLSKVIGNDTLIEQFIQNTIFLTDKTLDHHVATHPETMGMATTIVLCWIVNDIAYIAWCGDSRCYVFNPRSGLKLLTKDHSYVQELIDKGDITEEEAFNHPDNNIITRGLGTFDVDSVADIVTHSLQPDDILLLCSDGLSGCCKNDVIEKTIKTHYRDLDNCCDKLVQLALDAGGCDNICVALVSIGIDNGEKKKTLKDFFRLLFSKK